MTKFRINTIKSGIVPNKIRFMYYEQQSVPFLKIFKRKVWAIESGPYDTLDEVKKHALFRYGLLGRYKEETEMVLFESDYPRFYLPSEGPY